MSRKSILNLIDFDRTVFDTDRYFNDFCALVRSKFDVDVHQLRKNEKAATKKPGPYSPLEDLKKHGDKYNISQIKSHVREGLSGNKYIFPDAVDFIKDQKSKANQIVLMTVGIEDFQREKIALSKLVAGLPIIITTDTKSHVLQTKLRISDEKVSISVDDRSYSGQRARLVDDRAGTFDVDMIIDPKLELIRIRRHEVSHSEAPTPQGVKEITSFEQIVD